jgi:hypothetical protein
MNGEEEEEEEEGREGKGGGAVLFSQASTKKCDR